MRSPLPRGGCLAARAHASGKRWWGHPPPPGRGMGITASLLWSREASLLSVVLLVGYRVGEGRQCHCRSLRHQQSRETPNVHLESPRIAELGYQADVGETGSRTETKWARLIPQHDLASLKTLPIDPCRPIGNGVLFDAEAAQAIKHLQVLDRVDVTRYRQRKSAHAGAGQRIGRQEWGLWMGLVQPFDDRQRLREHTTGFEFERRHEALRIEREIAHCALFAFAQVMRAMLDLYALEVEGDPDAEGSAASKVSVQLHSIALDRH